MMQNGSRAAADRQVVTVAGRRVTVTHLNKVLYPATGTTRADVLGYYACVAPVLLRYARDRPVTRTRWVHGVGTAAEPGAMFVQKNREGGVPDWISHHAIAHRDHVTEYPVLQDAAALVWFAQHGALEFHVPQWRWTAAGTAADPDRLVLDLDPGEGVGLPECAEVARLARRILLGMGLNPVAVTSGGAGIHLYAALQGAGSSAEVSRVAHELARSLEADHRALVVSSMSRALRTGKVFVDWSQNNAAKTTIAPYSLRGRLLPFVAAPRSWAELDSPDLRQLDYREVLERLERQGDLLAAGLPAPTLPAPTLPAPEPSAPTAWGRAPGPTPEARLAPYRFKRRAENTPEPDGAGPREIVRRGVDAAASAAPSFVIHEHHARRLHWDLRLERDGVLVCWALPRGVATDGGQNRLAVHTEDHPLEYARFEGRIPQGEYGAGTIQIWDRGDYTVEKWRDDEVIVTLTGQPGGGLGGSRRFALIRTRPPDAGRAAEHWLVHLMQPAPPPPPPLPSAEMQPPASVDPVSVDPVSGPPAPMLASAPRRGIGPEIGPETDQQPEQQPHQQPQWAYEMKWDGMRALAVRAPAGAQPSVRLFSRTGREITAVFPELASALYSPHGALPADTIVDGEIVAFNRDGRPDFGLLQRRLPRVSTAAVAAEAGRTPVHFLLFDVLRCAGQSMLAQTYSDRRRVLEYVFSHEGPFAGSDTTLVQVPPGFVGDVEAAMRTSRELGLEGIVAKDMSSPYRPGQRSLAWVKLRHTRNQEVVVGGWRPGRGHRAELGALLLGVPGSQGLRFVGRVGTGFRDRDLVSIRSRLDELAPAENPFSDIPDEDAADAHWVRPRLVAEVEFAEWTAAGRLRHPSWRGWRGDKSPAEVIVEPF